jgi:CRP-like cAMP-binding protein
VFLLDLTVEQRVEQEVLRNHSFARGLSTDNFCRIEEIAESFPLERSQYLWRQGDRPDFLYLVASGQVSLEILVPRQGPLQVEAILPDELAGGWLGFPEPSDFDAHATTPVQGFRLSGESLRLLCARDSRLGYELLRRWTTLKSRRLQRARKRLVESALPKLFSDGS